MPTYADALGSSHGVPVLAKKIEQIVREIKGIFSPLGLAPCQDFRKFDSKFAGARSAQKFPHNLWSEANFAVPSTILSSHHITNDRLAHTHITVRTTLCSQSRYHSDITHRQSPRFTTF